MFKNFDRASPAHEDWKRGHGGLKPIACHEIMGLTNDPIIVSTVRLGGLLGLSGSLECKFETRIFGGRCDGECRHYGSVSEAEEGHVEAIDSAMAGTWPGNLHPHR